MAARTTGARGPVKALFQRPDGDEIILDLTAYYQQRATGLAPGETRLTLEGLSKKYKLSTRTLQSYERHVLDLLQRVRDSSAAVGVTQLDVIARTSRYYNRVEQLYEKAEASGDLELQAMILEKHFPIALDRMQGLVPKAESEHLSGQPGRTFPGESQHKGGVNLNVSVLSAVAAAAKQKDDAIALRALPES